MLSRQFGECICRLPVLTSAVPCRQFGGRVARGRAFERRHAGGAGAGAPRLAAAAGRAAGARAGGRQLQHRLPRRPAFTGKSSVGIGIAK